MKQNIIQYMISNNIKFKITDDGFSTKINGELTEIWFTINNNYALFNGENYIKTLNFDNLTNLLDKAERGDS